MLNRTGSIWDRKERIKINDNWDKLEFIAKSFNVENLIQQGLYAESANLIDNTKLERGKYVIYTTGLLGDNSVYNVTEYIRVQPNSAYWFEPLRWFAWYDEDKNYISGGSATTTPPSENPMISPENAAYVRLTIHDTRIKDAMFSKGATKQEFIPFREPLKLLTTEDLNELKEVVGEKRLHNISQIYQEWKSGNKFPIAFFDDSQTDGTGTTGHVNNVVGTDHRPPNAYPTLIQAEFRELSSNNSLRVYNAGFSGMSARWGNENFEKIFGSGAPYADSKMIFIGFGTNDRNLYSTLEDYYREFRKNLSSIIEKCFEKHIQPVLITEQPSVSPGIRTSYVDSYPLRTSGNVNAVTNRLKHDLAKEYNLEIIDLTELTRKLVHGKTSIPTNQIFNGNDGLHFGDAGHVIVKEIVSSKLYPFTLRLRDYGIIDLSSQFIEDGVPEEKVTMQRVENYICYCDYTVTADELLLKQSIFIDDFSKYSLKCSFRSNSTAYLKLNGVKQSTNTVTIEPGYHLIEVMSGTTRAGFNGITIEKAQE